MLEEWFRETTGYLPPNMALREGEEETKVQEKDVIEAREQLIIGSRRYDLDG